MAFYQLYGCDRRYALCGYALILGLAGPLKSCLFADDRDTYTV